MRIASISESLPEEDRIKGDASHLAEEALPGLPGCLPKDPK
jgi:hypothetical protein